MPSKEEARERAEGPLWQARHWDGHAAPGTADELAARVVAGQVDIGETTPEDWLADVIATGRVREMLARTESRKPVAAPDWWDPDEALPGRYLCAGGSRGAPFLGHRLPGFGPWMREDRSGIMVKTGRPDRVYGPIPDDEEAPR